MRDEMLALREERDALHVVLSAKDDTISALRAQVAVLTQRLAAGGVSSPARGIPARDFIEALGILGGVHATAITYPAAASGGDGV